MKPLIESVEQLQQYIRINKSADFNSYITFILDAQDKFISQFFKDEKIDEMTPDEPIYPLICRALAPFSMALATDEFSINFGEAGHTVSRSNTFAPASDAKIERAKASLIDRGWQNLDHALQYAVANLETYGGWLNVSASSTSLFSSAKEFQDKGMVEIGYSFLTFYHLRLLIIRIEKTETYMMLPAPLRASYQSNDVPAQLKSAMQAYTGSRVAYLHTSMTTRSQRANPGNSMSSKAEYRPVIRPLYEDMSDTGNYFEAQAEFWRRQIVEELVLLGELEADAGVTKWNSAERRIFVAGTKRS